MSSTFWTYAKPLVTATIFLVLFLGVFNWIDRKIDAYYLNKYLTSCCDDKELASQDLDILTQVPVKLRFKEMHIEKKKSEQVSR